MKIRDLVSYLLSELPKSSTPLTAKKFSRNQIVERLGWLSLEEADSLSCKETEDVDWKKGIPMLLQQADLISVDEGGEDEEKKKFASAPLGLKNRWRIWKILQGIQVDADINPTPICTQTSNVEHS